VCLPDAGLTDACKTGFIYTQIIRSGDELKTGANGDDKEFSHDVIGILANLFTQGYTADAHGLLLPARYVIGSRTQYDDGVWTYPWIWAICLLMTGDLSFVKANFSTGGPGGASGPSIKDFPNPGSPWTGTHPENGNGSSPHAWGMADANMVLPGSLAALRSDGSLVVGRGVPDFWVQGGQVISLAILPATGGRQAGLTIRASGGSVMLTLTGDQPAGPVLFQLPAFVDNIAHARAGTVKREDGHGHRGGHGPHRHRPADAS
jgi:hypothetical protein